MSETLPQPPDLDPITLSNPSLGRARRGFEPAEVNQLLGRAADALRAWQDVDHQLRSRIERLEADLVEARKLDEGRIASVLGEETARIISAAREAASEIRAKATEEAERLVKDAEETSTATANALTADAAALRAEAEKMRDEAAREYSTKVEDAQKRHDQLLEEAQTLHDELQEKAQTLHDELTSVAQKRHDELLEEGRNQHDEMISRAQERHDDLLASAERVLEEKSSEATVAAEEILEAARSEGRTMVAEAREVRDRILTDLADRRRIARRQIEGAVVGRDRIIELLNVAGGSVASIISELEDADTIARDHANDVAEALPDDTAEFLTSLDVRVAPVEDRSTDLDYAGDGSLQEEVSTPATTVDDVEPAETAAPGTEEPETTAHGDETVDEPEAVMLGDVMSYVEVDEVPGTGQVDEPEQLPVEPELEARDREVEAAEMDPQIEGAIGSSAVDGPEVGVAEPDQVEPGEDHDADTGDGAEDGSEPDAVEPSSGSGVQGDATVHDLFARIRAQEMDQDAEHDDDIADEDEMMDLDDDLDDGISDDGDDPGGGVSDTEGVVIDLSSADSAAVDELSRVAGLLDARDELLVPVERQMLRGLRRLASDEQNEVLDRLRRIKRGRPEMDDVIPSADEMLSTFSDGILADFSAAVRAGFDFWVDAGGTTEMATFVVPADIRERLEEIVSGFISLHRAHLERSMEQSAEAGTGTDELMTAIKSVYRDWRQSSLSEMAGDLAIAGFSHGERTAAGTGVPWMWVVDNGGLPCADGEDNALAGAVPSGDSFPTGDQFPPAHSGCRCILVPADH